MIIVSSLKSANHCGDDAPIESLPGDLFLRFLLFGVSDMPICRTREGGPVGRKSAGTTLKSFFDSAQHKIESFNPFGITDL